MMQGVDMAGRERKRALIARQGFRLPAEMLERVGAIVMECGGVAGSHRERPVEAFERFLMAFQRVEDDAQIGEHVRRSRPDLQGCSDQPQGFGRTTLLMLEHAAKMQRIEIGRISAKSGVVDLPRLVQPPLPM
jgi:hypothetical protein